MEAASRFRPKTSVLDWIIPRCERRAWTLFQWVLLAGSGGVALAEVASAAVPVLAGGALHLGNGEMVFNAMQQLKELSSEKKELLALQAKGETHTDRVLEQMDARTKKP